MLKAASGARKAPHGPRKNPNERSYEEMGLKERFAALTYVPPFFRLLWQAGPRLMLGNMALRIVRSAIPLATLYLGKLIIDETIRLVNAGGGDMSRIWYYLGLELALVVVSDLIGRGIALMDGLLGDLFTNDISVRLMRHAAQLDLIHFEESTFYDKLERARQQSFGRHVLMSQVFTQLQNMLTILFLAAGLVAMAPWLILLLLVALVPAFLGEAHFNARSYSLIRGWTEERRELDYLRYAGASNETAKEVKIFGLADYLSTRFQDIADAYYRANRELSVRRAGWGGLLAVVGTLGYYAAYGIIIWRTVAGQFTVGDLTFLAGAFSRLRGLLEGLLLNFASIVERALYLKDLFEFFEIKPLIVEAETPRAVPAPIVEGFRFENVGFRYPGTDVWAVRELDFTLHAGEILALVGENGAGKTTLVKLLARLYDPDEGRILLDGHDLRSYDIEALRQRIGVIFQDFVRYDWTAGENIAVGRIEQRDESERVARSAEMGMARPVIDKLPGGYAQMLGRRFSEGVELSGGEWQKIALARAYMRDADLVILDEPTAALDARAEYEVFQRFAQLTEGKMAVLISHRFSTVRMADRILVLDRGRLIEEGTHEQLLALGGRYAELFGLQAEGYR
ncbi:MAG: ABC transporter ATP-binding protein [Rhodothermales bacterium]